MSKSVIEQHMKFRIFQDGIRVVEGEGPIGEMLHYAMMYLQDGPIKVQEKVGRKWIDWTVTFNQPSLAEEKADN